MSKYKSEGLKKLFLIMAISQILGLYVGYQISDSKSVSAGDGEISTQISEDESSLRDTILIVVLIISMTFIILFIILYLKKFGFIKFLLLLALFITSLIVFSSLLDPLDSYLGGYGIEMILAIILCIIWYKNSESSSIQNIASIFTIAGAAAIIGSSFDVVRILILVCIISVWDIIAVKSKVMTSLVDNMPQRVPLSISTDSKSSKVMSKEEFERSNDIVYSFELGNADVIFPLSLAIAAIDYGILASIFVISFSVFFTFFMFHVLMVKKIRVFSALPPAVGGAILGLGLGLLV